MSISLPAAFFVLLMISVFSALMLLNKKVPLKFVRIHIHVLSLPPVAALSGLIFFKGNKVYGPWHFDSLTWLIALFVLTIGLIVQRYSVRYLFGDHSYRQYFVWLTITTEADSLAWLSDDLRLLLIFWGTTLLGLTMLIRLKKEWQVARNAARVCGLLFGLSWLILLLSFIWIAQVTGRWQLSLILTGESLHHFALWEKTSLNLLLMASVVIPAAQWPFGRWLLDSVVAPTPVSAVMHAGIVNAGGILLTLFAPLFSGSAAQIVLLVLSSISVLIGTGIMLVQVDYKRQLVGSTIAQMGFMLIQCALGAYLAAIIHAVLHGLFKSTLFLQAGSAVSRHESHTKAERPLPFVWRITGGILGLLAAVGFWLVSPGDAYQLVSAVILGWSVLFSWTGLVAIGKGGAGRMAGLILFAVGGLVYSFIHTAFYRLLQETVQNGRQTSESAAMILLFILLAGGSIGLWLARHRSSKAFTLLYLWLVRLGEPRCDLVESHPTYLAHSLSRGGHLQ